MKAFIFFITVMVVCQASMASTSELLKLLLNQVQDRDCTFDGLQCKNCKEMQLCSSGVSIFTVQCAEQNTLKPNCDLEQNVCTSTESCETPNSTYKCPTKGNGLYPDLLNCSKYHYCDGSAPNPVASGECPRGSVYDQKQGLCNQYTTCSTYSSTSGLCEGNINKFLPYTPSPNFYVLCTADDPILLECPAKYFEFDPSSVSCIFKCKAKGRFPYPNDKSKYYSCVYIGNSYVQQVLDCPQGTSFPKIEDGTGKCAQIPELVPLMNNLKS